MLQRLLLSGVLSGLIVGAFVTLIHLAMVTPIILEAETYETKSEAPAAAHVHGAGTAAHSHDTEAWAPEDGWERSLYTLAADLIMGVGFALLLASGFTLSGQDISARAGVLWGAAGYLAFSFLPALGLPPELPGAAAADLAARQIWWFGAAVASVGGLGLIAFGKRWMQGAGLVLLILPHIIGAPHAPAGEAGSVPPELAAHFVVMTMFMNAAMWIALGWMTAYFFQRFAGSTRGRIVDINA